jgi:3-oxoacyl-[acyl-carrier protein] reductase
VLGVTLDGPFLCSQAALDALTASGAGAIINIGGLTAYTGAKQRAHVVTAKAGLDGLTKALAQELAERGITVNLVSPGLIDTVRGGHSAAEPDHHKHRPTLVGRRGRPQEVAAMVRYLAGPNGRYLTGQTMHVNGGAYLP